MAEVPIISVAQFNPEKGANQLSVQQLRKACEEHGFFYISDHNISVELQNQLLNLSVSFFELPEDQKMQIRMELAGNAWRGYFPLKGELTSGKPDLKEGLYFGQDHSTHLERPMHGSNLYPKRISNFKETVEQYMSAVEDLGHKLMEMIALSLGLSYNYFEETLTYDPFILFRIFHYPSSESKELWGVGEHTDYGLLTLLKQDEVGGLQIKKGEQWIDAPYIEGTLVCNIGDMLSKMTQGYYRATPHRVKNSSGKKRYSFPLFFDPNWDAKIQPIDLSHLNHKGRYHARWDGMDLSLFEGTYGDFISMKVAKVFPNLTND
jgi:isopenicillin N synthase-like dioxygenase